MIEKLAFQPLSGISSPHLQTICATLYPPGTPPPSDSLMVPLEDGDKLCCKLSTPPSWDPVKKTVFLVHGLGGNQDSVYMIRLSRKLYQAGYRVVRINMRGCGHGHPFADLPYHGGLTQDIYQVLKQLKQKSPHSPFVLVGFSLGGNIVLKLSGEGLLHKEKLVDHVIAVCPPIDISKSLHLIHLPSNYLFHKYYLKQLRPIAQQWKRSHLIKSIYDFDNLITAPIWGFKNADDYYHQSSSRYHLSSIRIPCQILFSMDDPFIDFKPIFEHPLSSSTRVFLCPKGGHMGFLGKTGTHHRYFWLDQLLHKWISAVRPLQPTSLSL